MSAAVETMMYAKSTPWHGLGTYVGDEPVTSAEALATGGLDWTVSKQPVQAVLEDGSTVQVPGQFATVRSSDHKPLGVVGSSYAPVQNVEAFEFMDALAGAGVDVRYHTAGALQGGRKVWLLAELQGLTIEPVPGDVTQPYILLYNGHDGRTALGVCITSVRVVCQNTLNLALGNTKAHLKIRHTARYANKLEEAQRVLGIAKARAEQFGEVASYLASEPFTVPEFVGFSEALIAGRGEEPSTQVRNQPTFKGSRRGQLELIGPVSAS